MAEPPSYQMAAQPGSSQPEHVPLQQMQPLAPPAAQANPMLEKPQPGQYGMQWQQPPPQPLQAPVQPQPGQYGQQWQPQQQHPFQPQGVPGYPMTGQPYPQPGPYGPPPGAYYQGPPAAPPLPYGGYEAPNLPRESLKTTCPHCQQTVDTQTNLAFGTAAIIAVMFLLVLCFPFAWIPCVCEPCKDVEHKCPACRAIIGRSYAGNVRPGGYRRRYYY